MFSRRAYNFSVYDYRDVTRSFVGREEEFEKIKADSLIKATIMDPREHLKLLELIIRGHAGAKFIKVHYTIPGTDFERSYDDVRSGLISGDWIVESASGSGLIFHNIPVGEIIGEPEYDEYSYTRHSFDGNNTVIDFWTNGPSYDSKISKLLALEKHIRIQLWGLRVSKDRICRNDRRDSYSE